MSIQTRPVKADNIPRQPEQWQFINDPKRPRYRAGRRVFELWRQEAADAQRMFIRRAQLTDLSLLADAVADGDITVQAWEREMRRVLKDVHTASYLFGRGGRNMMTRRDWGSLGGILRNQYRYLHRFAQDVAAGRLSRRMIRARARMYAEAASQSFERAKVRTQGLTYKLPQYPGDGRTQCLSNCKCYLDVRETAREWRVYWRLRPAEHCPDCVDLAARWSPLVISKSDGSRSTPNAAAEWVRRFQREHPWATVDPALAELQGTSDFLGTLHRLLDRYPWMERELERRRSQFYLGLLDPSDRALARGGRAIRFRPDILRYPGKFITTTDSMQRMRWWPKIGKPERAIEYLTTHEFGHVVDMSLASAQSVWAEHGWNVAGRGLVSTDWRLFTEYVKNRNVVPRFVSEYAQTDEAEAFAESFLLRHYRPTEFRRLAKKDPYVRVLAQAWDAIVGRARQWRSFMDVEPSTDLVNLRRELEEKLGFLGE